MSSITLKQALRMLGWTQKAFAQHIGYDENTVSRWCATDSEPQIVSLYIGLMLQIRQLTNI